MIDILGTGLSGLVGSRIIDLLSPICNFENLSLETGVDITDADRVKEFIAKSPAAWVFHFAARTDVDGAEKEITLEKESPSWKVNVQATENIVSSCQTYGKKMLYISTDFVFDGTKEQYVETDTPNPQGWYAKTKYEGELRVQSLGENGLIIRIANPYRSGDQTIGKPDFIHKIKERLEQKLPINAPSDQLFIPTFIDDIALAIQLLVEKNASGLFHVVGSQVLSPYDVSLRLAQAYELDASLIQETTFATYFAGRAARPFHAVLNNDKIKKLGATMHSFDVGLALMREQELAGKATA